MYEFSSKIFIRTLFLQKFINFFEYTKTKKETLRFYVKN